MIKGQRNPFDTAVAISIPQYRLETLKFDLCDSLITALNQIVGNQEKLIYTLEKRVSNLNELNRGYIGELERKNIITEDLSNKYKTLWKLYEKENRWIKKNGAWVAFGAGLVAGSVATYYVIK